jgi:hypothetical protein
MQSGVNPFLYTINKHHTVANERSTCIIYEMAQTSVSRILLHILLKLTEFSSTLYKYPHKNASIIKHTCHQFVQIIVTVDIKQQNVQKDFKQILWKKPNH